MGADGADGPDTAGPESTTGTAERRGFLGREALEIGALLLAGGAAHLLVIALGHSEGGGALLIGLGAALVLISSAHRWRRQHRGGPRPARRPRGTGGERLWRLRVAVEDLPGGLAALTSRLAGLGVDIRLVQVHPGAGRAVDDFYLTAPARVGPDRLRGAVLRAGGRDPVVEPAEVRELSDTTSRALSLAAAVAAGGMEPDGALAALVGADGAVRGGPRREGEDTEGLAGTAMTLAVPGGGTLTLHRGQVPFTPVEFARCRAFVEAVAALAAPARAAD
ncbi:hypothetical protein [Nocardiopsis potens]|uniref:hypothetical protein n=1 Tax=Nocardiopsis potens TaxID=1246458 RepID=UPI00034CA4F4|nr:hypothetical protein [Nocardiopsis potens]